MYWDYTKRLAAGARLRFVREQRFHIALATGDQHIEFMHHSNQMDRNKTCTKL